MNTIPRTSGIYKWTCTPTGKIYIGSAINLYRRRIWHVTDLRKGTHHNHYLQNAWNKYGESAFTFDVIELVLEPFLLEREQYWLGKLKAANKRYGFNHTPTAGSLYGFRHSEETRAKMRESGLIAQQSRGEEWNANLRVAIANRSSTWRANVSAAQKARWADPVRRAASIEKHVSDWEVIDPNGKTSIIRNLSAFCRENGLDHSGMVMVSTGKRKHHKGWRCRKI